MDGTFLLLVFVEFFLGFLVILSYIYLCINVSKIKKKITPKKKYFDYQFNLLLAIGEKEKAKQLLIDTMFTDKPNDYYDNNYHIAKIIKKYKRYIDRVGLNVESAFLEAANK